MTLEESIRHFARTAPDRVAAVCSQERISYQDLWKSIEDKASQLRSSGLQHGRPYVFRATQDIGFLIEYCAVHHAGAIAVPLGHSETESNMRTIREEVESLSFEGNISDILYTTGTTGKSKGVMLSETALVTCSENFICDMQYTDDLCYIISGPLNHIASLFKIHPILSIGGTVCILDGLKDMNSFYEVLSLPFSKFATFLVPASIRMLLQFSSDRLHSYAGVIDFIETGAAPISRADMKQLSETLPHSRLYNTYGGTEIGAVCTYNFNDGRYLEGCVGHPMKHSAIEITPEGGIIVSGPTVMSGYVGDEDSTRQILRDGRIYTSDLGYVDSEGMLHITGRQGNVINVGGFKVNPEDVERAALSHPSVAECVCVPAEHPVLGTVLKLVVVLREGCTLDRHSIAAHIGTLLESHKIPVYYESVASLQRTYNGKLDRQYYQKKTLTLH